MGPAGLLFGYNNEVPVTTPAHSLYGAVVPPTPTTTMATMTPLTTRIRAAIPSYQNYPVSGGWSGWRLPRLPTRRVGSNSRPEPPEVVPRSPNDSACGMDPHGGNDAAFLPDPVRIPEPGGHANAALAVWFVESSGAICSGSAGDNDSVTYTDRSDSDWKSASDGWGTASFWGNASDGPTPAQGAPTPSGPPPPLITGYAPPQVPPPYRYGNAYGQTPDPRRYGMPSTIRDVIKMIQPFYSDSTTVDKARSY
ncbi:hypothetical protein PR003_g11128 [Phytophthora rubi]|uniref:Uncharacterized protein n=1 Tax=Phytophthora rubi TaxID=129364 RepID=A0A6A4FBQ2_9STRA|nr:hypothetical protein PR003_g11128 [Phytophthora rubi]